MTTPVGFKPEFNTASHVSNTEEQRRHEEAVNRVVQALEEGGVLASLTSKSKFSASNNTSDNTSDKSVSSTEQRRHEEAVNRVILHLKKNNLLGLN